MFIESSTLMLWEVVCSLSGARQDFPWSSIAYTVKIKNHRIIEWFGLEKT